MKLEIKMNSHQYDVVIEKNSLNEVNKYFDLSRKVLILTDSGIPSEYVKKIVDVTKEPIVHIIEQGEASKSFNNFEKILDVMIENRFSRSDCVVACGGGVVGDLAGFVASVYMRGIDFYNVPTTLLSQVDSSIGGKTAIDKLGYKNVVGAFYPPKKVLIDSNVLKTLDQRNLHAGLVEALKMGLTCDKTLVDLIKESNSLLEDIDEIIIKALQVKKYVVETDPYEQNIRKVLNFGHTVGHAVEAHQNYNLLHGECVGIGMLYFVNDDLKQEITTILNKYNLPTTTDISSDELYNYITLDKKRTNDDISIVLVNKIGTYEIKKIKLTDIKQYL